jgi:hypothetical protein
MQPHASFFSMTNDVMKQFIVDVSRATLRRGVAKDLEVPFWARDASEVGVDRSMDLPCYGAKLKKDYDPPFTCGSDTRRSIIKYFVRDEINRDAAGNSLAEQLVRQRIAMLKAVWNDTANYACDCPAAAGGASGPPRRNLSCCRSFEGDPGFRATEPCTCLDGETESVACCEYGNNFMPDSLGGVLFDEVPAEDVVASIMGRIPLYLQRIMTDPGKVEAFTKYNDKAKVQRWDWASSGMGETATKASGLFATTQPIMFYNASEAGFPFRKGETLWETCAGLVSQVCGSCMF